MLKILSDINAYVKGTVAQNRLRRMMDTLPIDKNKIVIQCYEGRGYSCNPRAIADELLATGVHCDVVWLFDSAKNGKQRATIPSRFRIVEKHSVDALRELATARIWLSNIRFHSYLMRGLRKRDGQKYIQTWHGSIGFKKIGSAVSQNNFNANWTKYAKMDAEAIDYAVSNSAFEDRVYQSSFWVPLNVLRYGHPRNDIFFRSDAFRGSLDKKIRAHFKIADNCRIALYAPTFREKCDDSIRCYFLNPRDSVAALKERFGGEWRIVAKLHPRVMKKFNLLFAPEDCVVNASHYPDLYDLLAISNVMISDYSSAILDFLLTGRPAFIHATDKERYDLDRGFYYPLEESPFPISENERGLYANITGFNQDEFSRKSTAFLEKMGVMDDGRASGRVVGLIKDLIDGTMECGDGHK